MAKNITNQSNQRKMIVFVQFLYSDVGYVKFTVDISDEEYRTWVRYEELRRKYNEYWREFRKNMPTTDKDEDLENEYKSIYERIIEDLNKQIIEYNDVAKCYGVDLGLGTTCPDDEQSDWFIDEMFAR